MFHAGRAFNFMRALASCSWERGNMSAPAAHLLSIFTSRHASPMLLSSLDQSSGRVKLQHHQDHLWMIDGAAEGLFYHGSFGYSGLVQRDASYKFRTIVDQMAAQIKLFGALDLEKSFEHWI